MSNTNYLYKQLTELNKKYESTSFVDIDIIDLFDIKAIDINSAKKIITNKYYSLALKYHPDKYHNISDDIIDIINISILIDEIKSGQFLSFINDIYKILISMIVEDRDNLVRIINGGELLELNFGGDHSNLKQHFNNKQIQIIKDDQHIDDLKKVIIDTKIDLTELDNMVIDQETKRKQLQIENIFVNDDTKAVGFKTIFNDKFVNTVDTSEDINIKHDIVPYNEINTNQKLISIRQSTSISEITEAFEPIKINRNVKSQIISFDELVSRRETETISFKVAKNFKKESDLIVD